MEDPIDWSMTSHDIAELNAKIVSRYWEEHKNVVHAVVRVAVSKSLYHHDVNMSRAVNTNMFTEW